MAKNSSNLPERPELPERPVPPSFRYDLHIIHLVDKIGVKEAAAQLGISIDSIANHLNAARKGLLWAADDDVNLIEGVNRLYERIVALEREIYSLKDENFKLKILNDHLSGILRSEGKDPPTIESVPQLYYALLRDDDDDCDYLGVEDLGYEDWQQPRHYYDE